MCHFCLLVVVAMRIVVLLSLVTHYHYQYDSFVVILCWVCCKHNNDLLLNLWFFVQRTQTVQRSYRQALLITTWMRQSACESKISCVVEGACECLQPLCCWKLKSKCLISSVSSNRFHFWFRWLVFDAHTQIKLEPFWLCAACLTSFVQCIAHIFEQVCLEIAA